MTAVFMHKETFALSAGGCGTLTVTRNKKEYSHNCADDFIEVDEFIAVPVQILNRKGYKTACCCAGHAPNHMFPLPEIKDDEIVIVDYDVVPYCTETYITFLETYDFPFLPEGFTQKKNKICKQYDKSKENAEWEILLAIMDSAKALHHWAVALPDLTE